MGQPQKIIKIFLSDSKGNQIIYGPQVLQAANLVKMNNADCGIYTSNIYDWDLNSRWINALAGTFTDETFNIYWNTGVKSQKTIVERYNTLQEIYQKDLICLIFEDEVLLEDVLKSFAQKNNWNILKLNRS